jgi:uncharacterized protein (TIGR00255 family)
MIRSMTGYGRAEAAGPRLGLAVEVKSVNHRHLDVAVKLPRAIASLEMDARRLVQSAVQRGRVDVSVSLVPVEGQSLNPLTLNLAQAREYMAIARRLADETSLVGGATVAWLLDQPGVITRDGEPAITAEEAWPLLEQTVTRALGELVVRRETEGEVLRGELRAFHAALAAQVAVISARAPVAVERRSARLRERIEALRGEAPIDETRIATEVAVWAERTDISEELARLRAHLDQLAQLLDDGGPVGRTLDFLIQEINREVNTVGSKADDLEISQAVIATKSVLEKLREQTQNIE